MSILRPFWGKADGTSMKGFAAGATGPGLNRMCGKRFSRPGRDELSWTGLMSCRSCVLEKGEEGGGEIGCLLCPRWDRRFARSALMDVSDWGGMFFLPLALDARHGDSRCSYIRGEISQLICGGAGWQPRVWLQV